MLSDEMTTGSVTSSDAHKRVFAQRSHAWNILQPRFKEAFLEVSPLFLFHSLVENIGCDPGCEWALI
jgi:hypothetical protein